MVAVLKFPSLSWTLLWLVQNTINLLESNPNVHGFLSFTVTITKKIVCINFKSTVQDPESSLFDLLRRGDHFRSGIIYGTIWRSVPVLGSFAVQSGGHLRHGDHLRAGIICGHVQIVFFLFYFILFFCIFGAETCSFLILFFTNLFF